MDRQALIEQCERARRASDAVSAALEATRAPTAALLAEARRIGFHRRVPASKLPPRQPSRA